MTSFPLIYHKFLTTTIDMFSISQAWYIVKTLQVYFEQSDQENAGWTGLAHAEWT